MTELALPSPELFDRWVECVREFGDDRRDGSGDWQIDDFGPDRRTFERLLELYDVESDLTSSLPEGHVHCNYSWIVDDGDILGFMAVRHSIDTEFLRTLGGHIGYSIRPSRRRQGHAARALGLALARAREIGLDRVLVTCDHDNVGSARVIEGAGGALDGAPGENRRYWISL